MAQSKLWFEDIELQNQLQFYQEDISFKNTPAVQASSSDRNESKLEAYIESKRIVVTPNSQIEVVIGYENIVLEIIKCFIVKTGLSDDNEFKKPSDSAGINGFLLAGIPGVGKSTILKAVAVHASKLVKKNVSFFNVRSSLLKSKYHGETGKLVDILYEVADRFAPTILLIDEIDGMCGKRKEDEDQNSREFKNQLLGAMNGIVPHPKIITCGATNKPFQLDEAFVRRFDLKYILRPPNASQRIALIKHNIVAETGRTVEQHNILDFDEQRLSKLTSGFTGQNIAQAVKLASAKTTCFVYKGKLISNEEFEARIDEIETNKDPLSGVKGTLTMEILTKYGIERVIPSYDYKEGRKLEKWAVENCDNAEDINDDDEGINATCSCICCTHIPFVCCFNRC